VSKYEKNIILSVIDILAICSIILMWGLAT